MAAWRRAYAGIMPQDVLDSLNISERTAMWRRTFESRGKGSYIVVEVDGSVEGFAVYGPARDEDLDSDEAAELVALNVNPEAWSEGLGGALLRQVIQETSDCGCHTLYLWVATRNTRAIAFYEKHGFISENKTKSDPKHSNIHERRYVKNIC